MKCISCDVILTPFEATRRYKSTGECLDLCNACFKSIADEVPVIIRKDLANMPDEDMDNDDDWMDEKELT